MKNKLILIAIVIFTPVLLYKFYYPEVQNQIPPSPQQSNFILGAMNNSDDQNYSYISDPNTFGMNLWHRYTGSDLINGKYYPTGWTPADKLFADPIDYEQDVKNILTANTNHGMKTLMHRPKIEWLCYGQRSDYQCESEANVDSNYWFYSFQRSKTGADYYDNTPTYGNDHWVKYCRTANSTNAGSWVHTADTVAARLKANSEQTNGFTQQNFNHWNDKPYRWFIKPNIRIDKDFANNNANLNTQVCRIDIYDANGYIESNPNTNKIKSIDIRVRNFRKQLDSLYNGHYKEEFNFGSPWNDPSDQFYDGAWSPIDTQKVARGRVADDTPWDMCKADIRVYWYGQCDMWIDYVRVDNEVADELFKGIRDPWIQWEANLANYTPGAYKFYIEEFEFNNVPCIEYVNKKLKQLTNPDVGVMCCFFWRAFMSHMNYHGYTRTGNWTDSKKLDKDIIHEVLMDKTGMDVFFTETYPFTANDINQQVFSKIPNTLTPSTNSGECVLAYQRPPSEYDDWL